MNKLIFFNIIFLFLWISCDNPKEQEELTVKELRALYDSYLHFYTDAQLWEKNHQNLKEEYLDNANPAYYEAIEIAHKVYWRKDEKTRTAYLDSLIKSKDFKNYHIYNQFTAYLSNSRLYSQMGKTNLAISNAIKADQVLGDQWDLYGLEKNKIRSLMFESILQYSIIANPLIEINEEYVENLLKSKLKPDLEVIRSMSKLVLSFHHKKDYAKSQLWVRKLLNLDYDLRKFPFYSDLMYLKCTNFRYMKEIDSMRAVNDRMKLEFKNELISERVYRIFQMWNLNNEAIISSPENALKVGDTLNNYIAADCRNKYNKLFLSNNMRKVSMLIDKPGQKDKEVFEALSHIRSCTEEHDDNWEEEMAIIDDLLSSYSPDGMNKEYKALLDRREYLANSLSKMSQSFLGLNNYFAGLENKNQNQKNEYEQKKSEKSKVIFYMILALLSILILGLAYLLVLFRKNHLYRREIMHKKNQLKEAKAIVKRKNDNLIEIKEFLEERNLLLKNFAFEAAKDIKSPILVIQQNLEEISKYYISVFQEDNQAIMQYLNLSIQQLATMIETLLEYSTKEKNIDRFEIVDISEKLEQVFASLSHQIYLKNAKIKIPEELPYVLANNSLIEKLFQNLLSNALKYSKDGMDSEIEISFKIISQYQVQFAIKDNGIGIPEESLKEIFQIFHKLENENKFEGNGIGLSICKKIVLEFDGNIWVESELNKGSIFYFTLPYLNKIQFGNPTMQSLSIPM